MFPLILSWVSMIHWGQGFTIDILHVYIDGTIFADGQAYTAPSRVRRLKNLHIKKLDCSAFKTSEIVIEIMSTAKEENILKSIPMKRRNTVPAGVNLSRECVPKANDTEPMSDAKKKINNTSYLASTHVCPQMQSVHSQMAHLGQSVLHLILFNKPINMDYLRQICTVYQLTIGSMVYYRTKLTLLYSCTDDVIETKCDIPQSFMNEYIPIKTPGNGNCLFHAVSIALNGTQNVTRHLCLLLISVFVLNINTFMSIISKDKAHVRDNASVEKVLWAHCLFSTEMERVGKWIPPLGFSNWPVMRYLLLCSILLTCSHSWANVWSWQTERIVWHAEVIKPPPLQSTSWYHGSSVQLW